jgi:hypothetical protein
VSIGTAVLEWKRSESREEAARGDENEDEDAPDRSHLTPACQTLLSFLLLAYLQQHLSQPAVDQIRYSSCSKYVYPEIHTRYKQN